MAAAARRRGGAASGGRRPRRPRPKRSALKPSGSGLEDGEGEGPRRVEPEAGHLAGRGQGARALGVEAEGDREAEDVRGQDTSEGGAAQAVGAATAFKKPRRQPEALERVEEPRQPQRRQDEAAIGGKEMRMFTSGHQTWRPGAPLSAGAGRRRSRGLREPGGGRRGGGLRAGGPGPRRPDRGLRAGERGRGAERRPGGRPRDLERVPARLSGAEPDHREGDDLATLEIGRELWPFPAPLVRDEAGWHFDAEAAREEVLLRRIGRNELDVIDLLRGYVDAQAAYRAMDPDGDGLPSLRGERAVERGGARRALLARGAGRARRARSATSWRGPRPRATASRAARTPSPSPTSATTSGS